MNTAVPVVPDFLCIAHRGASGHEPENTLLAVARALALSATWIELDVFVVEGELVVIHDDTLERTTNGTGRVMDRSLAYLRALDAGKGQRIPFLREVLDLVNRRAGINIELKGPDTGRPALEAVAVSVARHGWTHGQFILSSASPEALQAVKRHQPEVRTGLLLPGPAAQDATLAEAIEAYSVHPSVRCVNPQLIADAHARGLQVYVYTVNTPDECRRLRAMGADGVFTDYPEIAGQVRGS